jgi:nucleoside-diphosphate-sugar epimerase
MSAERTGDAAPPVLMVTGASGYIGQVVVRTALADGVRVRALMRRPTGPESREGLSPFAYDLSASPPEAALVGAAAVIHLAFDHAGAPDPSGHEINLAATDRLLAAARRQGVPRFVFVSSQSAGTGTLSGYGRSKAEAEALMTGPGELSVRPGMVCGGPELGLYGRCCAMVRHARLLPVPRAGAPVQPIHVEDLARALIRLALGPEPTLRLYRLAQPQPISFAAYLTGIARSRFGRSLLVLPVPLGPLPALIRALGPCHPALKVLGERLAGLEALAPMATRESLAALGLELRDFEEGLRREAR